VSEVYEEVHALTWEIYLLERKVEAFRGMLRREWEVAAEEWAEADADSHASGYFDGLQEAQHFLALSGLDTQDTATAVATKKNPR
jgi:hypothetical protein